MTLRLRSLPQVSLGFRIAKHRIVHRIRLRKQMDRLLLLNVMKTVINLFYLDFVLVQKGN